MLKQNLASTIDAICSDGANWHAADSHSRTLAKRSNSPSSDNSGCWELRCTGKEWTAFISAEALGNPWEDKLGDDSFHAQHLWNQRYIADTMTYKIFLVVLNLQNFSYTPLEIYRLHYQRVRPLQSLARISKTLRRVSLQVSPIS